MKAIIWGYKYDNMRETWYQQMNWVSNSLRKEGVDVVMHDKFKCRGLDSLPRYDFKKDNCDICIYNHTDISHIIGNVIPVKENWFFKPTVPDEFHTTLDKIGYGAYSSVGYIKPDFESLNKEDTDIFFNTKVKNWIDNKATKWGKRFDNGEQEVEYDNYYLVLGQCGGDEVVTRHDFGHYFTKLEQIVRELSRIDNKLIVVKLHPYTDGEFAKDFNFSMALKSKLEMIDQKVKVFIGKSNVHNFIDKAYCILLANSGAGFEVMMHRKPMITWGFPEYHWITYDLRHLADLRRAVKLDWFKSEKQDMFLYWYMEKYCFYNQETCDRRVRELCYV
jgi:hypothetical protein